MAELVTVWNGSVKAPHRGYLTLPAYPVKPAPPLTELDREPTTRQHRRNPREYTINNLQQWMGTKEWTITQLAVASGYSNTAVERAMRRCVADGRVVMDGYVQGVRGICPRLYRWAR